MFSTINKVKRNLCGLVGISAVSHSGQIAEYFKNIEDLAVFKEEKRELRQRLSSLVIQAFRLLINGETR